MMKKFVIGLFFITVSVTGLNAQFTKIGIGGNIGTGYHFNNQDNTDYEKTIYKSPLAGIFITGIYELKLPIHLAPSFTYNFTSHNKLTEEESRVSSIMVDIDGHYVFNSLDRVEIYALAGLNVNFTGIKWPGTESSESDNVAGLNLGCGSYFKITETIDLYGEAKYIVSKYDHAIFRLGLLLNLDWIIKHGKDKE
jgi:hypothetical protein